APEDIEYGGGKFFVKGSPDRFKTIQDIALMANVAWNYPKGVEPGLEASAFFDPPNFVYPFGAHLAVVEVDGETGEVTLKRYNAVMDALAPLGVKKMDMPLTPEKVWRAMRQAKGS